MEKNRLAVNHLSFNERLRVLFRPVTDWFGQVGARLGINPDVVSLTGFAFVVVASLLAAGGDILLSGIVLIPGFLLDTIDGAIARAVERKNNFGPLLDSTLDRYADGFIFCGLAYYFASQGQMNESVLAMLALVGAFVVSYVRARAEGIGIGSIKAGWFDRFIRSIILAAALVTGWVVPGLLILAVGSHLTAIQRLVIGYQETHPGQG